MKIYTKKGDAGETGLFGGTRVPKDDLRIQTYGTLDELNSVVGLVLAEPAVSPQTQKTLSRVQADLFQLGAELATPRGKAVSIAVIGTAEIEILEKEIDQMETTLQPLKTFILPGGSREAAFIHLARTVSRRAERELVTLNREEPVRPAVLQYLNRLSDFFFVLARFANSQAGIEDIPWLPR